MESVLFHGSNKIVEHPSRLGGKVHNDYGQGFYCTPDQNLAREWACSESPTAFVNHYSFEPSFELRECNLSGPGYHVLNWLAVLLVNRVFETTQEFPAAVKEYIIREYLPDLSGFDIIRGYRADDSYFGYANLFLQGTLSVEQLARALRIGKLGEQVFLQSQKAFDSLVFLTAEEVDLSVYRPRRLFRERKAREDFLRLKHSPGALDGLYAIDIYRNKIGNDDARLR